MSGKWIAFILCFALSLHQIMHYVPLGWITSYVDVNK